MNIDTWLIHTVTIEPLVGRDSSGDPTFGEPFTAKARVEMGAYFVATGAAAGIQSNARMMTVVEIHLEDRVWLPGDDVEDVGAARRPITVQSSPTKDGEVTLYQTFF